ncbi:MAG: hypothetical protein ACI91R_001417, partial [Vicingaceae bacterium]
MPYSASGFYSVEKFSKPILNTFNGSGRTRACRGGRKHNQPSL